MKGASEGQGLGNKFLANIRECDAIIHVSTLRTVNNIRAQAVREKLHLDRDLFVLLFRPDKCEPPIILASLVCSRSSR